MIPTSPENKSIHSFGRRNGGQRGGRRGQIFSKILVSLTIPGASNRAVKLKEVIADYLAGPFDPQGIIEGEGGFGSYPVMTSPRHGVIVLEQTLAAPPGSNLELVFEHGFASTRASKVVRSNISRCPQPPIPG